MLAFVIVTTKKKEALCIRGWGAPRISTRWFGLGGVSIELNWGLILSL